MLRRIRKADIRAADTVFWFLFAACLFLFALIPQIAYFFTELLRIESPANFIFLFVIAILFIREFITGIEIAKLREKLNKLSQEIALADHKDNDKEQMD